MDIVVANELVVEIKAVDRMLPIYDAQILTYLRLSGHKIGLLINFNSIMLKDVLKRVWSCSVLFFSVPPGNSYVVDRRVSNAKGADFR